MVCGKSEAIDELERIFVVNIRSILTRWLRFQNLYSV